MEPTGHPLFANPSMELASGHTFTETLPIRPAAGTATFAVHWPSNGLGCQARNRWSTGTTGVQLLSTNREYSMSLEMKKYMGSMRITVPSGGRSMFPVRGGSVCCGIAARCVRYKKVFLLRQAKRVPYFPPRMDSRSGSLRYPPQKHHRRSSGASLRVMMGSFSVAVFLQAASVAAIAGTRSSKVFTGIFVRLSLAILCLLSIKTLGRESGSTRRPIG